MQDVIDQQLQVNDIPETVPVEITCYSRTKLADACDQAKEGRNMDHESNRANSFPAEKGHLDAYQPCGTDGLPSASQKVILINLERSIFIISGNGGISKQGIPQAWEGKSHQALVQAVFEYTRDTIISFREGGAMPAMVQCGNEISNSMLWPDGRLPVNWDNFSELTIAGINGVDTGGGSELRPFIMMEVAFPHFPTTSQAYDAVTAKSSKPLGAFQKWSTF